MPMKLRIATYNIHKGISSIARRPRVHALKQGIASLAADVVFLQEVQGRHDLLALRHASSWPAQEQHEFLSDRLIIEPSFFQDLPDVDLERLQRAICRRIHAYSFVAASGRS